MKYVLVIGDGMSDNPVESLGGLTPLEYAKTPVLDKLSQAGVTGTVRTVPEGVPPGSDTAILSIFGCDPRVSYTGRAPLEAAATGIELHAGDVAYRCNMVTLEETDLPFEQKRIISHSAGSIEGEESAQLVRDLFSDPRFGPAADKAGLKIYPALSFRHIAVQTGADIRGLTLKGPHDYLGDPAGLHLPKGSETADVLSDLMRLAHEVLSTHPATARRRASGKLPANGIWFWAEGTAVKLPQFTDNYGKTGGVISAVPLCHGIAALTGLERIFVEGATGELETNYEGKVDAALNVLKNHDFAAIHIEAPDECTHNGDTAGKLQAIENIDSRILGHLKPELDKTGQDYRILILADHKTLTSTRGHDGAPVPYTIYDSRYDTNTKRCHTESDAASGPFVGRGTQIIGLLFEQSQADGNRE